MKKINGSWRELPSHRSRCYCFLVDICPPSFSTLLTRKGWFAWPSLLLLFIGAGKMTLRSRLDGGMAEEKRSTGSFSVLLRVTVLGKMACIFLLWSIKIICYTSKGMSLKKGSGSCSLFNQLFTTCGSILDENRIAFSSNSSPEFYSSQYSDSVIHPASRTKGFINIHVTTPFSDRIKY